MNRFGWAHHGPFPSKNNNLFQKRSFSTVARLSYTPRRFRGITGRFFLGEFHTRTIRNRNNCHICLVKSLLRLNWIQADKAVRIETTTSLITTLLDKKGKKAKFRVQLVMGQNVMKMSVCIEYTKKEWEKKKWKERKTHRKKKDG